MFNPKIIGILGLQGEGKTALSTYFSAAFNATDVPIYANYNLKGMKFKYVDSLEDVQKVRHGLLVLDEIWTWVWSRTSQSNINKEIMKIIMLNRKRGVTILYTAQLKRTVDVILRDVTTYTVYPALQPITMEDGTTKYLIKYIVKDQLGRYSDLLYTRSTVDVIGEFYDTNEEIKALDKNGKPLNGAVEIGIGLEEDFARAVKKLPFVRFVDILPDSGNHTSWNYDVLVYTTTGIACFDVKGCKERVYQNRFGKDFIKQVNNGIIHNAKPYYAYPIPGRKILTIPSSWYIYPITYTCYLSKMKSTPRTEKLIKNSIKLPDWEGPKQKIEEKEEETLLGVEPNMEI
jgi:hypothetical protein